MSNREGEKQKNKLHLLAEVLIDTALVVIALYVLVVDFVLVALIALIIVR